MEFRTSVTTFGLALWLALLALVPGMDGRELTKLSTLAAHYQEHRNENQQLDWWGYLALHYLDAEHQAEHRQENPCNLPFHQAHAAAPVMLPSVGIELCGLGLRRPAQHQNALKEVVGRIAGCPVFRPPCV
jgi:hypothetical protein